MDTLDSSDEEQFSIDDEMVGIQSNRLRSLHVGIHVSSGL